MSTEQAPHCPLRIAVVGHTNTGKTSLLRTLTRDSSFGEVSFHPATTRHVEAAQLLINGSPALALYDTPGMEEPIALLELLEQIAPGERLDGPERIQRFLQGEEAGQRFEQEAKVLRQMLHSDAAIYVIDARDPVLAKHRDELEILRYCGVPLLPLLNFTAAPWTREDAWRDTLARVGLHAIVRFDTVTPERDGEALLYEKLATLMDRHRSVLTALIEARAAEARQRHEIALKLLAELLVDVAACRRSVHADSPEILESSVKAMHQQVRDREQYCIDYLLDLYRFSAEDVDNTELPLAHGHWEQDLFDPYALQVMGIRVGGGAATGAAMGAGIDLMVGGLTLGAAAAIGALAGGGMQTLRHYGSVLWNRLMPGQETLRVNDNILRLLALRQLMLVKALEQRGHAASSKLPALAGEATQLWPGRLPEALRKARANPQWSALEDGSLRDSGRDQAIDALARTLAAH